MTNAVTTAAQTADIRDIKPPVEITDAWAWLWWTLGVALLLAALLILWRLLRRQMTFIPAVPPVPAHMRARNRLADALTLITQPKPFVVAVSDAARAYLEERFTFRAPERTTEEFLRELQATDRLLPDQKESLGQFLESCDLVKFAKYEPGENELRGLHSSAMQLVEETEPDPAKQPPVVPAAALAAARKQSKGRVLAVAGAWFQLGPAVWLVCYLVVLFKTVFTLMQSQQASAAAMTHMNLNDLLARMSDQYGGLFIVLGFGMLVGLIGILLLVLALTMCRYRAVWFFWFLMAYSFLAFWSVYCIGPLLAFFFVIYCLVKRKEFFKPH